MRQIFIVLLFVFSVFSQNFEITYASVEDEYDDFATVYAHVEATWEGYLNDARLSYDLDYFTGGGQGTWQDAYEDIIHEPPRIEYYEYFDDDVLLEEIADIGVTGFRVKFEGYGDTATDETNWYYFDVIDVVAPASISGAGQSWSSNHPHLSWDANEEIDLQYYEVWKKRGSGSWSLKTTTTNTSYTDNSEEQWSPPGSKEYVYYKMRAVDYTDNESGYTSTFTFAVNQWQQQVSQFDIAEGMTLSKYILLENYPNPFNPATNITYGLPEQSNVRLRIYAINGEEIATIADGLQEAGFHTAKFDGSNLTSGVYIYRFSAKGMESGKSFSDIKRMLLIK